MTMSLIEIDFRLTDVEFELWALGEQRTALEENIRNLTAQDRVRTEARLREAGASFEDEEVQQALEDHDQRYIEALHKRLDGWGVLWDKPGPGLLAYMDENATVNS